MVEINQKLHWPYIVFTFAHSIYFKFLAVIISS